MGVLGNLFTYISRALGMADKALPKVPESHDPISSGPQSFMNLKRPQEQESYTMELGEAATILLMLYQEFEEYRDAVVLQILWYKSTETVQHEFVIVKGEVTCVENGEAKKKDIYCKVERTANIPVNDIATLKPRDVLPKEALDHPDWSEKDFKQFQKELRKEQQRRAGGLALYSSSRVTSDTSQASADQSRSSSPSSPTGTTAALDLISRLPDNIVPLNEPPIPAENLATLSFHGNLPYFRDIILAASVISAANPVYNVMMSHCYWFAQAFVHVLQMKYQKSCSLIKLPEFNRKAGKMRVLKGMIPILSPQTRDIANEVQGLFKRLEDRIKTSDEALENSHRAGEARERAGRAKERAARLAAEAARMEEQRKRELVEQQLAALLASMPNRQDGKAHEKVVAA
ncbi:hypothetical protein BJ165DRAFT_223688 [Panaeolus papilionaceus]|nr:hypothetical protein BJ165DRAFT_223688 [Panaeolus papilionaceus]